MSEGSEASEANKPAKMAKMAGTTRSDKSDEWDHPHVMIDLETLGTEPGSVILSIGMVTLDADDGRRQEWSRCIDVTTLLAAGFTVDTETAQWWSRQSEEARAELWRDPRPVEEVMMAAASWLESFGPRVRVWGNAPSFDCRILATAMERCGIDVPWRFWNERCFRTFRAMHPGVVERDGAHHDALADARAQAMFVVGKVNAQEQPPAE